jgi:hypothetical protein
VVIVKSVSPIVGALLNLLLIVVACDVSNLERSHIAIVRVEERPLGAYDTLNLAKSLHGLKVCELDVCRDQVYIPKHEQSMEINYSFHAYVRQIRQVDHEASHDIEHDPKLLQPFLLRHVDLCLHKLAHGRVSQSKVLKDIENAR